MCTYTHRHGRRGGAGAGGGAARRPPGYYTILCYVYFSILYYAIL